VAKAPTMTVTVNVEDLKPEDGRLLLCGKCLVAYRQDQFDPTPNADAYAHIHRNPVTRMSIVAARLKTVAARMAEKEALT